jgi:hypothetical protein
MLGHAALAADVAAGSRQPPYPRFLLSLVSLLLKQTCAAALLLLLLPLLQRVTTCRSVPAAGCMLRACPAHTCLKRTINSCSSTCLLMPVRAPRTVC